MHGKRILVVDDDPLVRESIQMMLELDGHSLDLVSSADEALQRYACGTYDLILSDHRMGGMTGLQLAAEIKSRNPAQPFLLFSGSPPIDHDSMCDLVLMKPFSANELRAAVNRVAEGGGRHPVQS